MLTAYSKGGIMFTIGLAIIGTLLTLVIIGGVMDCIPYFNNIARKLQRDTVYGNDSSVLGFFFADGSWRIAVFRVLGVLIMGGIFVGFWGGILGAFIYCLFVAPILALLIFLTVIALLFFTYLGMGF